MAVYMSRMSLTPDQVKFLVKNELSPLLPNARPLVWDNVSKKRVVRLRYVVTSWIKANEVNVSADTFKPTKIYVEREADVGFSWVIRIMAFYHKKGRVGVYRVKVMTAYRRGDTSWHMQIGSFTGPPDLIALHKIIINAVYELAKKVVAPFEKELDNQFYTTLEKVSGYKERNPTEHSSWFGLAQQGIPTDLTPKDDIRSILINL